MNITSIKTGDTVTFRAVTRFGAPKLTRKVSFVSATRIGVRAHGWDPFLVRPDEILEHSPQKKNT